MKFIALKTNDGQEKGRISLYCRVLKVTRQGFREYLENNDKPWRHEALADKMMEIIAEDEWNDTYGRERMHKALILKYPDADILSESTVYRVMRDIGLTHKPNRGSQYTSEVFRQEMKLTGLKQSMNSAGGRCHDNARCESMWARMKWELFYSRGIKSEDYTIEQLKSMIWRYFMSYWNNRRICLGNNGLPPTEKRQRYYASVPQIA